MCLNSRGLSWSFYQGQRIIKSPVMRTVWKYAYVTESGLAVPLGLVSPLGYSPACCERIQTLDLPPEFSWGRDRSQANAPNVSVCFLYLLSNTCSRHFLVGLLNLCLILLSYLVSISTVKVNIQFPLNSLRVRDFLMGNTNRWVHRAFL